MATPEVLAARVLAHAPAGLLSDLDGTLAPIVADPTASRPVPGATDELLALARRIALVGVVTGRAAAEARRILGTDQLLVVGNHGVEWLAPGADHAEEDPAAADRAEAVERALAAIPPERGAWVERKGLSATIHVRGAPDPAAARARIRAALVAARLGGVSLRPGRMSLELRPTDAGDKGTAVREAVRRHALAGLVVLGDDVTDLDMFRAAADLRAAGQLHAAILAVRGGHEVPREVAEAADAVLGSPEEVVELLRGLGRVSA